MYEAQPTEWERTYALSPSLLTLAASNADRVARQKIAIVPAGGAGMPPGGDPAAMGGAPPAGMAPPGGGGMAPPPGGDPAAMGAAPPPDPAAGGGADPAMLQSIVQQVIQAMGAGGAGAGAAGGKKKVDPAVTDAKMYDIDKKLSLLCDHFGITIPASETIGLPPDPMAQQQAQAEHQNMGAAIGAGAGGGGAPPPGGDPGIQPVAPLDPSQGPPPPAGAKTAAAIGAPAGYPLTRLADIGRVGPSPSFAARSRSVLGIRGG